MSKNLNIIFIYNLTYIIFLNNSFNNFLLRSLILKLVLIKLSEKL